MNRYRPTTEQKNRNRPTTRTKKPTTKPVKNQSNEFSCNASPYPSDATNNTPTSIPIVNLLLVQNQPTPLPIQQVHAIYVCRITANPRHCHLDSISTYDFFSVKFVVLVQNLVRHFFFFYRVYIKIIGIIRRRLFI